jgi:hypothetical protein
MKLFPLFAAAALTLGAVPAQAGYYTHTAWIGNNKCTTTLRTYGSHSSSETRCRTLAELAEIAKHQQELENAVYHDYRSAALELGYKLECGTYATKKATYPVSSALSGQVDEYAKKQHNTACQQSFIKDKQPPADYTVILAQ